MHFDILLNIVINIFLKVQKLETELARLRAELQAQNKQCQKLRAERDAAVENSQEATERATALEQVQK